jgi:spore coat polysaccharide biosynthesis protein SpsF (cytidylyltransferase family)
MSRTGVIAQARIGSNRLPGKVLMRLGNKTVLAHVVERCRAISGIDVVCCAVPDGPADDRVAEEARRCGAEVFRGSETDVLDRYYRAAATFRLDVILRVTADCPLLDPGVCDEVLSLRSAVGADYACNNLPPSWPHGLDCEAMTFAWLERAAHEASQAYEREHVTPFIRNHPAARRANLRMPRVGAEQHRWTLDNERDLQFLRALVAQMPAGRTAWSYAVPLAIVEAEPSLPAINAGQDRWEGLKRSMRASA